MTMKTLTVIATVLILLGSQGFARIGETAEQCDSRYGAPLKVEASGTRYYERAGINIGVIFFEGKADSIFYMKKERTALGKPIPLSENEIEIFLNSNAEGRNWKVRPMVSLNREWEVEGGELQASYVAFENILAICTSGFIRREQEKKNQGERKALEGF